MTARRPKAPARTGRGSAPPARATDRRRRSVAAARRQSAPAAGRARPREPPREAVAARLVAEMRQRRESVMQSLQQLRESWARVREWDPSLLAEAQAALAEANLRFGEFYDFVPTPFLVLDERLRIVQVNAAAAGFLDGTVALVGQPLVAYVAQDDLRRLMAGVRQAQPGEEKRLELRVRSRGGWLPAQFMVKISERAASSGAEPPLGRVYYVAIVDLSEIRRLEQEQRRSADAERAALAAAKAKDEFIAMLSHELRTPLTPILAAADVLREAEASDAVHEAVAIIRRNVLTEARLVDDLLDVARLTQKRLTVEAQPLSLHSLIGVVVADWAVEATAGGIEVRLELGASRERVEIDAGRIAQVLRNVLGNALKFTDPGGRILIKTEDADDFVRVCIDDTGRGMTPAEVAHLFEPFAEAREQVNSRAGLGLGLVISHGIVEAHRGRIRVRSRGRGLGTTVEVELPVVDTAAARPAPPLAARHPPGREAAPGPPAGPAPAALQRGDADEVRHVERCLLPKTPPPADREAPPADREAPAGGPGAFAAEAPAAGPEGPALRPEAPAPGPPSSDAAAAGAASNGRRVLLVEDHADSAETLSMVLSMKGFEVQVARTVGEAERLLDACDLMISDISLPDGSGLELMQHARRHRPLRAIALSGFGTEDDRRRSRDAGFAEHLTKPVDIDRLLAAVQRLAAGH